MDNFNFLNDYFIKVIHIYNFKIQMILRARFKKLSSSLEVTTFDSFSSFFCVCDIFKSLYFEIKSMYCYVFINQFKHHSCILWFFQAAIPSSPLLLSRCGQIITFWGLISYSAFLFICYINIIHLKASKCTDYFPILLVDFPEVNNGFAF